MKQNLSHFLPIFIIYLIFFIYLLIPILIILNNFKYKFIILNIHNSHKSHKSEKDNVETNIKISLAWFLNSTFKISNDVVPLSKNSIYWQTYRDHPTRSESSKVVLEQRTNFNNWCIRRKVSQFSHSSFISAAFFPQKVSFTALLPSRFYAHFTRSPL